MGAMVLLAQVVMGAPIEHDDSVSDDLVPFPPAPLRHFMIRG